MIQYNILPCQYRNSHFGDNAVWRLSYLHDGICHTGKATFLYWIRTLLVVVRGRSEWYMPLAVLTGHPLFIKDQKVIHDFTGRIVDNLPVAKGSWWTYGIGWKLAEIVWNPFYFPILTYANLKIKAVSCKDGYVVYFYVYCLYIVHQDNLIKMCIAKRINFAFILDNFENVCLRCRNQGFV